MNITRTKVSMLRLTCETADQVIYKVVDKKVVTRAFTRQFLDAELYVRGRALEAHWKHPEQFYPYGGIFSIAYIEEIPIAIAAVRVDDYPEDRYSRRQRKDIENIIGDCSVVVHRHHRKRGYARGVLSRLEHYLIRKYGLPVAVRVDPLAASVFRKRFNKVGVYP